MPRNFAESDLHDVRATHRAASPSEARGPVFLVAMALSATAWAGNGGAGSSTMVENRIYAGAGGIVGGPDEANGHDASPGGVGIAKGGGGGATDISTGFGGAGGMSVTNNSLTAYPPSGSGAAGAMDISFVNGAIAGGSGSNTASTRFVANGAGAGGGGVGVSTGRDLVVAGDASITGGAGGHAGNAGNVGGGGGGGGAGLFSTKSVTVAAGATITGGAGGSGTGPGGSGGGGIAVIVSGPGTLTNAGELKGGTGGSSGTIPQGGFGGAGIWILDGGTLVNQAGGTITGGAPSAATGRILPPPTGGMGVVGSNATVVNAGAIVAGKSADAIRFIGGANSLEVHAGSTIDGNAVAFSAADTLKLGGNTDASFDVSAIGAGAQYQGFGQYQKTGAGTWTLTGASTEAMPWTVRQGKLVLDGSIANSSFTVDSGGSLSAQGSAATSSVTVNSGGTLFGSGTVGPTTVRAGGTIAPGNSIGTKTVMGAYVQESGSVYQAEVDPGSSASDRIAVTGTATIQNGAILDVTKTTPAPYVVGNKYTVLTATDGVTGVFDVTGDIGLSALLHLDATYDAGNAYLEVRQTRPIVDVAATANQAATASGLDSLGAGAAAAVPVVNQQTDAAARAALDQLTGEVYPSVQTAMLESSHFSRDAVSDRLADTFTCPAGDAGSEGCGSATGRPTGWARFHGNWGHTDVDSNVSRLDSSVGGFFMGVDMPLSERWRAGVLTGYSHGSYRVSGSGASADSDDYHLGVYGGAQWGALGLRTGATYTWHDISADRRLNMGGFSDHLSANYNAATAQVFGELGYKMPLGSRADIEAFLNLAYVNQHAEGFNENGGDDALRIGSQDMDTGFSTLGVRGSTHFTFNGTDFRLKGMVGWRYAVGDVRPVASESFQGGSSFDISGAPVARNQAVVDLGVGVHITRNATISLSYNGQFSSRATGQGVLGALNVAF